MNTDRDKLVKEIFADALEKANAAERAAYLAQACGNDAQLRQHVEALLQAHEKAGGFLEEPAAVLPGKTIALSTPLTEKAGDHIGHYKLLQQIGEGGCGVVYMAEQEQPIRRRVALKVIKLGMDTKAVIARFEAERQALALMDHPNIAKVLDAGATDTGRPYFVMELVRGIKITDYCDQNNLSTEERLDLFVQICHAIQHAHQKGIIHRDIKPSNILVTVHDGKPLPKIIDFGIAKATSGQVLTDKTLFTAFEQFIGTPAYMSPEQAEMSTLDIDTRSDIYALGVLLYELLTGRTPFDQEELVAAGLSEMRRIIREEEPLRPSTRISTLEAADQTTVAKRRHSEPPQLIHLVRGDLDWIVMKCLEKDRTRRYETANGLAHDILCHLNNEPVLARPPSTAYRFQKLVRRNKLAFTAAAAVLMALLVGLGIAAVGWRQTRFERDNAFKARTEAQASESAMRQLAYDSDMSLVQQALRWNNLGRAQVLLNRHRPKAGEKDLRGWEWRYLWQECRPDNAFELQKQEVSLYAVDFSPDGKLLATSDFRGRVKLWDFSDFPDPNEISTLVERGQMWTPRTISTLIEEGQLRTPLCFSRTGKFLAVGTTRDGSSLAVVFDVQTRQAVAELPIKTPDSFVASLAFTPDEKRLVTMEMERTKWVSGNVRVWDWERRQEVLGPFPVTFGGGTHFGAVAVSPDGRMLAIGDPDKVQGIDLVTGKPTVRFPTLPEAFPKGQNVISLAFSPDSKQLAVGIGYLDGTIRLFDVNSGKSIGELPGHLTGVLGLRFSKDGKRLVSVSGDQSLRVWDVENWGVAKQREHLKLMGHGNEVFCLALKPDADYIAITGCKDGTLLGWDLRRKTRKEYFNILPRPVKSVEFSADSRFMFTVNGDHSAGIWTARPKISEVSTLSDAGKTVTNVTRVLPSPDGKYLAVGTTTGQVKVFDIANRRKICDLNDHEAPVAPVGFTHDGNTLITVDDDGVIIEWSTASWGKISMSQEKGVVWADHTVLSDAPNTGLLLLAPSDLKRTGWVSRWNLAQRKEQPPIDAHFSQEIGQMSISPDGQILAISASDTYVKLFNVATGEPWKPDKLRSNLLSIHGVTFSPDEPRLATGCTGNEAGVKLWDLTTGQDVLSLEAGTGMFFGGMRFSPDGNMIVAISTSGAHVWRAPSWEEITAAEAREKTTPVSSP